MYNTILVPLDGSELAEQVLPPVIELAHAGNAEIVLLRVLDPLAYDYLITSIELTMDVRKKAEAMAEEYLLRLSNELRPLDLKIRTLVIEDGAIGETILQTARSVGADLIAMCTHGRSGLPRLVMGSVADEVVRHTELPVLLMRPRPVHMGLPAHYETGYVPLPVN